MSVPELHTQRLLLRGWREEDLEAFAEICADPVVMDPVGWPDGMDREDAWRHMAFWAGHWDLRGYGHWALETLDGGELIGRAGLYCPEGWPGIEVGWLTARAHWGLGYAPEAGLAAMGWGHDELGLDHLISLIADDNDRSARVAEKLGMTLEGRATVPTSRGEYDLRVFGADLG